MSTRCTARAVYSCGGQGHIEAKCGTSAPAKGEEKDGGKGGKAGGKDSGNKEKDKEEWNGFCSYCGEGRGQQRQDGEVEEDSRSAALTKRRVAADLHQVSPAERSGRAEPLPSGAVHERENHRGIGLKTSCPRYRRNGLEDRRLESPKSQCASVRVKRRSRAWRPARGPTGTCILDVEYFREQGFTRPGSR